MLRFTDGLNLDTSGPLRTVHLRDGWYVLGDGMSIPARDEAEAKNLLATFQRHEVSADSRAYLNILAREPMHWAVGRPMPKALGDLVNKGLAFRSHTLISITDKGREVLDRVG